MIYIYFAFTFVAPVAQPVEHVLGKDEVTGSRPVGGLKEIYFFPYLILKYARTYSV